MAPPKRKTKFVYQSEARKALLPGEKVYFRGGRYVLAPAGSPPPVVGSRPAAPSAKPMTLAQQQLSEAEQIVAASVDPQVASINKAIAAAESARALQLEKSRGITDAYAAATANDAEAVRQAYADAAARIGQYGESFTGEFRDLYGRGTAQANETLARLAPGMPGLEAPMGQVDVRHYVDTALPGAEIATAGPRTFAAAQAGRRSSLGALADAARVADYNAGLPIEKTRQGLLDLEAKRPGLILEALGEIRQQANAKRATDVQIGTLQLQQAKTQYERAIALTNLTGQLHIVVGKGANATIRNTGRPAPGSDAVQSAVDAETSRANNAANNRQRAADRAARNRNAALGRTAATNQAREAEAGRNARAAAGRATQEKIARQNRQDKTGPGGITANERASLIEGAHATGMKQLTAYLDRVAANIENSDPQRKNESIEDFQARMATAKRIYQNRLKLNYGTAMAQVVNVIGPMLKLAGWSRAKIFEMARQIVGLEITPPARPSGPATGR